MKSYLLFLSLALFAVPASALDWSRVYTDAKPGIPMLFMSAGYCSGSLIAPDVILTAAHCVSRMRPVRVSWSDQLDLYEPAKVSAYDRKNDLALLRLEKPSTRKPLKVAAEGEVPKAGEPVATIGHPAQRDGSWAAEFFFEREEIYLMSSGIVSGVGESDMVTDVSLTPGNSGGPLLNAKGEIVGVASRKRIGTAVGSIGFAPHVKPIRGLISQNQKDGDREPFWGKASTGAQLHLTNSWFTHRKNDIDASYSQLGFRLDVDAWDRLRFEYSGTFSGTREFAELALGWKFQILESSQHVWNIVPFVSNGRVSIENDNVSYGPGLETTRFNDDFTGFGLGLETSRFPVNLRLFVLPLKDQTMTLLQAGIPVF